MWRVELIWCQEDAEVKQEVQEVPQEKETDAAPLTG